MNRLAAPTNGKKRFLTSWNYDVWHSTEEQLCNDLWCMFTVLKLPQRFGIQEQTFLSFLNDIRGNRMQKNPYHNFLHLYDVTRACFVMLSNSSLLTVLEPIEVLGLMVAALVHDLDHPGLSNSFQVTVNSPVASAYEKKSVLEQHHLSETLKLLTNDRTDILRNTTSQERCKLINIIVHCVLATDMDLHSYFLKRWESCCFDPCRDEHRMLLMQMMIKCADISNPSKEFETATKWGELVQEEFFRQGDLERALNLPISPFMDREKPNQPLMQTKFCNGVVIPLFKAMAPVLALPIEQLEKNLDRWKSENRTVENC